MRRRSARAFTLLEVLVAGSLMVGVIGLALHLFAQTSGTVGESVAMADAGQRANRFEALLVEQLSGAWNLQLGGASLSDDGHFTSVEYQRPEGLNYSSGSARYGPTRALRFELDSGEALDGDDDDGDGLVDEGDIVLYLGSVRQGALLRGVAAEGLRLDFRAAGGVAGSGGSTPNRTDEDLPIDRELQVTYVVLQRLPRRGDIHRERREVRIAFRNQ